MFFSATITPAVRALAKNSGVPFEFVDTVGGKTKSQSAGGKKSGSDDDSDDDEDEGGTKNVVDVPANLDQRYILCPDQVKLCYLHWLLAERIGVKREDGEDDEAADGDKASSNQCIIFVNTIKRCQEVTSMLEKLGGFKVTCLHALQSQRVRLVSLIKFKGSVANVLVATDVASRGLDIPAVRWVVNLDLPLDQEEYVHRVGRTARAGASGTAVSFVCGPRDADKLKNIEAYMGMGGGEGADSEGDDKNDSGKTADGKQKRVESFLDDEKAKIDETYKEDYILTKYLSKTSKAFRKAQLLLFEIGFDDQLKEHKERKRKFQASQAEDRLEMEMEQ